MSSRIPRGQHRQAARATLPCSLETYHASYLIVPTVEPSYYKYYYYIECSFRYTHTVELPRSASHDGIEGSADAALSTLDSFHSWSFAAASAAFCAAAFAWTLADWPSSYDWPDTLST